MLASTIVSRAIIFFGNKHWTRGKKSVPVLINFIYRNVSFRYCASFEQNIIEIILVCVGETPKYHRVSHCNISTRYCAKAFVPSVVGINK